MSCGRIGVGNLAGLLPTQAGVPEEVQGESKKSPFPWNCTQRQLFFSYVSPGYLDL